MGKAMVDLPDPLENLATGSPTPASADDLLAQLAGEEIDRLLSEADARPEDIALRPPEPPAPPVDLPAVPEPAASSDASDSEPPVPAPAVAAVPTVMLAPSGAELDLSQQLDDLFNKLVETDAPPVAPTATVATSDPQAVVVERRAAPSAEAEFEPPAPAPANPSRAAAELSTTVAERSALRLASAPAEAAALDVDAADEDAEPPTRWWLLPLEWLNAPLDACPDVLRQAIGKIALLTMFNAVAVLIYVFFFRKH